MNDNVAFAMAVERQPLPLTAREGWSDGVSMFALTLGADLPVLTTLTDWTALYDCELVSDTGPVTEQGSAMQVVAFNVPDDWRNEVDRWYAQEHIDMLMRASGWLRARRYRVRSTVRGSPFTSIALHDLRDVRVMDSPERTAARSTPWRATMADLPWFVGSGRWLHSERLLP